MIQTAACSVASLDQSRDVSAQSMIASEMAFDRELLRTRLRRVQAKFGRGIHGENVLQRTPPAEMKEALEQGERAMALSAMLLER
jgi:hypothetical protein